MNDDEFIKEIIWLSSSLKDMKKLPRSVQRVFGYALHTAQIGEKPREAKALKGFGGMGVLELVEDHRSDTYRAVYTVRFATKVYVLHVFQKKSKKGIATPKKDMDLIHERLKLAERLYKGMED